MIGEDPAGGVGGINQLKSHLQVEGEQQQQNGAQHVESELTEVKKDGESAAPNDESGAGKNSADLTAADSSTAVIDPDSAAGAPVAEEEDDGDPIDMSFPKDGGWKQIVIYLFSFPIMFPLFITLPDTKNPKSEFAPFRVGQLHCTVLTLNLIHLFISERKLYPITFIGSIVWIAIYSYLMVWWTTIVGDAIGIPSVVSARSERHPLNVLTRGQWPYTPASTRAMRNRHVVLYDLNYPRFEISNLEYPGIHVHIVSNDL